MSAALDLGALVGRVALNAVEFDRTYVRVVRQMADLGAKAEASTAGTSALDRGLTGVAGAGDAATAGLGGANAALTETGLAASRAAVATQAAAAAVQGSVDVTTEAGLATSRLTQAQLRAVAAQERLAALQETGTATTRQLAAAQASLIAANDRVALSEERVGQSMVFGARSADTMRSRWEAVPGPVKLAAAAITFAAVESIKAASNYQKLTVNLVTGAGEQQRNLKMVSDGMLHMAGQVGDSAQSLAKAMFTVESAGFHGAAGLTILKTAAEGAKVDNADLTTVVDALTSSMNAYHEPAANAARVTNTLIASAAVGKMHLQDLAASLGTVLPSAAALRVPLDQVGAAMATMTMQGTNADRAATYLRFAFAALANPTAKASQAMKNVGLTSEQVANTMTHGGLPAVFQLLQTAVGEKFPAGSARYLAALANMVGGTRGLQAVLELTGANLTTMQRNLAGIDARVNAAGNSVSEWDTVQKNLNVRWSQFVDGLGAAGIKLGEVLMPAAAELLHILVEVGSATAATAGFFEHNTYAATALGAVLTGVLVPKLAESAMWLGRVVALNAAAAFMAIRAAAAEAAAAFVAAEGGVAGFAAALEALNLNPVILALTAVAALGFAMWHVLGGEAKAQARAGAAAVDDYVRSLGGLNDSLATARQHAQDLATHGLAAVTSLGSGNLDREAGAIKEWGRQLQAAIATSKTMAANEAGLQTQFGLSRQQVENLARAYGIDLTKSYGQVAAAVQGVLTPTQQATGATKALGRAAQGSADEVKALTAALDLFAGNAITADQGAIAFRNDIAALDKALHKSSGSLSLNSQASRDARDALDSAAQQALNTAEAQAKLKNGTDKARATLQDEIKTLQAHAGNSAHARDMINKLQDALNHLPGSAAPATGALHGLSGAAKGVASSMGPAGAAAARSFGSGFSGVWDSVIGGIHQLIANLPKVHGSPSVDEMAPVLFIPAGQALMGGLIEGINNAAPGVVAATHRVFREIAAAVAPAVTDPTALAAILSGDITGAVGKQQSAQTARAGYQALNDAARDATRTLDDLKRADARAEEAAKRHALALANEAHAAHEAAANMTATGKAAAAAKAAAERHARALDDEARTASQDAQQIASANTKKEKSAQHAADVATKAAAKAKQAYDREAQAAQAAAQVAAQAAQALVQSLSDATDAMLTKVSDFESSISAGITGGFSLSGLIGSLTGTDANGNPIAPTLTAVQQGLDGIIASAQQFSTDLTTLAADGADQTVVSAIAGLGPAVGDALAKQLEAAGPQAIAAFQQSLEAIQSVADSEGAVLAKQFFGQGASSLEQLIQGMMSQFPALKKALQAILDEVAAVFGSLPTVPAAVSTTWSGFHWISPAASATASAAKTPTPTPTVNNTWHSGWSPPHFASGVVGFAGGLAMVGENGPELVTLPRGANVHPHGSDGASLGDVVDRLARIEAHLSVAPERTGAAIAAPLRHAAVSTANTVSRNRRAGR